jgi:hypothetical protein
LVPKNEDNGAKVIVEQFQIYPVTGNKYFVKNQIVALLF